jgi:glycosyltransferase involved in cell wall biosynthesis
LTRPVRVVLDARIPAEGAGGVQQVIIGLAAGLTAIGAPDIDYSFLAYPDAPDWLLPYVDTANRFRYVAAPRAGSAKSRVARGAPWLRPIYHALAPDRIPRSDGSLEALEPEIIHFTSQTAFLTSIPSIFHPHDLQHLHLPQLFSQRDIRIRERRYRAFCEEATLVPVASSWGRDDILKAYGLPEEKIAVVPLAPIIDRYPEPSSSELPEIRQSLDLPERFAFYPAQSWPHKNHEMLLRAAALLKQRDALVVPLVFSGSPSEHSARLRELADALGIGADVRWLGFVEPSVLSGLYRLAHCVVVPTLFEAASFPIWEAFISGVPVACSDVTSLPRQVGDAAVVFDPRSPESTASAIARVWADVELREQLVERGRTRVSDFTWERTARLFAAHYRRLAGRELTEQDRALLAAPPAL